MLGLFFTLGPVRQEEARAYDGTEEGRLLELMDGYRMENGLAPLAPSGTLGTAAYRHSEDMANYGFFSHATGGSSYYPVGSFYTDRLALEGYVDPYGATESLAWGQATAEEVFEGWRLSPEHDARMLDPNLSAVGVGRAGLYWTAVFGPVA